MSPSVTDGAGRPDGSRRAHQRALTRARQRRLRRRRARLRRIRMLRAVRSLTFWSRSALGLAALMAMAFWARFAVVFDIPPSLQTGPLSRVRAYVVVKPWWFGPPAFDIAQTVREDGGNTTVPSFTRVADAPGPYQDVWSDPNILWVARTPLP